MTYGFDFTDRPLAASSGATTYVSSATYAPFGPEASLAYGNGTTKTMTYDLRYRPSENKLVKDAPPSTSGATGRTITMRWATSPR